jgi:hypothetical protein
MIGYIYKHTAPNGKSYIGQTIKEPKFRWSNGKGYLGNKYFTNVINKYGWNNITHEIIWEIENEDINQILETLNILEEIEISEHNTFFPDGYNFDSGGKNKILHEHTRKLVSSSLKTLYLENPHLIRRNYKMSDSSKANMIKSLKKYYIDNPKKLSKETRIKISLSRKNIKFSEEHRKKISKNKKMEWEILTQEQKIKRMSHLNNNEVKKRVSESLKGKTPWNKGKKGVQVAWNKGMKMQNNRESLVGFGVNK